jgi:hypothetical protein
LSFSIEFLLPIRDICSFVVVENENGGGGGGGCVINSDND